MCNMNETILFLGTKLLKGKHNPIMTLYTVAMIHDNRTHEIYIKLAQISILLYFSTNNSKHTRR